MKKTITLLLTLCLLLGLLPTEAVAFAEEAACAMGWKSPRRKSAPLIRSWWRNFFWASPGTAP